MLCVPFRLKVKVKLGKPGPAHVAEIRFNCKLYYVTPTAKWSVRPRVKAFLVIMIIIIVLLLHTTTRALRHHSNLSVANILL